MSACVYKSFVQCSSWVGVPVLWCVTELDREWARETCFEYLISPELRKGGRRCLKWILLSGLKSVNLDQRENRQTHGILKHHGNQYFYPRVCSPFLGFPFVSLFSLLLVTLSRLYSYHTLITEIWCRTPITLISFKISLTGDDGVLQPDHK